VAALRAEPTAITIAQKITDLIIVLIKSTNMVSSTPTEQPTPGSARPMITPTTTAMVNWS
jgi:hypothetical protein